MRPPDDELLDLVAEGHAALTAPTFERVSRALECLPRLVSALDRVSTYQTELRDVRMELTKGVRGLRQEVWDAQRDNPDVTFRAGKIHQRLIELNTLLDRLDRLIFSPERK